MKQNGLNPILALKSRQNWNRHWAANTAVAIATTSAEQIPAPRINPMAANAFYAPQLTDTSSLASDAEQLQKMLRSVPAVMSPVIDSATQDGKHKLGKLAQQPYGLTKRFALGTARHLALLTNQEVKLTASTVKNTVSRVMKGLDGFYKGFTYNAPREKATSKALPEFMQEDITTT